MPSCPRIMVHVEISLVSEVEIKQKASVIAVTVNGKLVLKTLPYGQFP